MLSPELKRRVLEAAAREPAPARPAVAARTRALLASAVLLPLGLFAAVGALRPGPRPLSLLAATGLGTALLAALALWGALGRGGQMLGRARAWLVATAVAAPAVLLAWKALASASYAHMSDPWPERPGLRCLALTLGLALWPLVALAVVRRGTDPSHPLALGAAMGVAVGVAASALVDLWCPVGYVPHLLVGHLLPTALLGLAGVGLGRALIAVRGRA